MLALILAYQRPQLLSSLVSELLKINKTYSNINREEPFSRIVIAHDGPRENNFFDAESYRECFDLGEIWQKQHSNIQMFSYKKNIGLTPNLFRVLEDTSTNSSQVVIFEEDKAPTLEGIEFLNFQRKWMDPLCILDTLPMQNHVNRRKDSLSTLFTDNGNQIIGEELLLLTRELWLVKDKFQEDFEKNLFLYLSNLISGYGLKRAQKFYSNYFSWGLVNPDRPDSLLAYALLLKKKLKVCPTSRLSEDWSHKDHRGKNINYQLSNRNLRCVTKSINFWGFDSCSSCELFGISERVGLSLFQSLGNSLKYRLIR